VASSSTIAIDGDVSDWEGVDPILVDEEMDVDSDGDYLDVKAVYVAYDEAFIYVRIDVAGDVPIRDDIFTCYKKSFESQDGRGTYYIDLPCPSKIPASPRRHMPMAAYL
jgi:hypothetical protein